MVVCEGEELVGALEAEFVADVGTVVLDGAEADAGLLGDLLAGHESETVGSGLMSQHLAVGM